MLTTNLIKEDLSDAYLIAVSAINGFSAERNKRDNNGVDVLVKHNGRLDATSIRSEGVIGVQLKATANWSSNANDHTISYASDVKNYNDLRDIDVVTPRILILLCLPPLEVNWLTVSEEALIIQKCAYWFNLRGLPDVPNTQTVTVRIPAVNLLTKDALRALMIKVQRDEDL